MTHPSRSARPASLLTRILETPNLVPQIQSLPAPSLLQIVTKIGIEDSAEILALATTEQLTRMVDEDLWRQESAGHKESFDPDRLLLWLRALEEMGGKRAAVKLAEMDEGFLAFAFGHYLHALDLEALQFLRVQVDGDSWQDDWLEKLLDNHNCHELGRVLVLAKATAPWDTLLNLLLALDEEDSSLCDRLLAQLAASTSSRAEKEGGLEELLNKEEMLGEDAAHSRNARRTKDGFVPAEDALAFQAWLKATSVEQLRAMRGRDPVSSAYFREYEGQIVAPAFQPGSDATHPTLLQELLEREPGPRAPLLLPGKTGPLAGHLSALDAHDQERFLMELNFLAQVLMLTEPAPLRQVRAAEQVIQACERGIELAGGDSGRMSAVQLYGLGTKS